MSSSGSDGMHEWALARAVLLSVLRAAGDAGASRLKSVEVAVGELQDLDEEAMRLALDELSRNTPAESASWEFRRIGARFRCRACGAEWGMGHAKKLLGSDEAEAVHFLPEAVHAFIRCSACGSPDFEILEGRGVWVERIKALR